MTPVLELHNVSKSFGALAVTRDVSLSLSPGARHALIGPNGAGKTTLVNLITGVLRPNGGSVHIDGRDVTAADTARRVKAGLARTFQINSLFLDMTVAENIAVPVSARRGSQYRMLSPLVRDHDLLAEVDELLTRFGLRHIAGQKVRQIAYGQRRLVEVMLALALRPKLLLLDEPAAGLPSRDSEMLFDFLQRLPDDVSVLVVEHDMDLVFRFARDITVLVEGSVLLTGPTAEVRTDTRVRDVYLGRSHG